MWSGEQACSRGDGFSRAAWLRVWARTRDAAFVAALSRPSADPASWTTLFDTDWLAVYRFGQGERILLMPGPHCFSRPGFATTDVLINGLTAMSRQVITFDPPGSGRSTRPARLSMRHASRAVVRSDASRNGDPHQPTSHRLVVSTLRKCRSVAWASSDVLIDALANQ